MKNIINSHKSILFLDGLIDKKMLTSINMNVPLIAADGAFHKLKELNLIADYVIGDGDSIGKTYKENSKTTFLKDQDQDTTDFEKSIFFIQKNNLFPCLVLGVNGGEIDHIIGNVALLLRHFQKGFMYFLDSYNKNGFGLKLGIPTVGSLDLELDHKSTISFITFKPTYVKTKGLVWELDTELNLEKCLSLRNESRLKKINVFTSEKTLLVVDVTKYFKITKKKVSKI